MELKDLEPLITSIVDLKTQRISTANQLVMTEMVSTLVRRGQLQAQDVESMLARMEAAVAAYSATAPETAKAAADAALVLRHALTDQPQAKPS